MPVNQPNARTAAAGAEARLYLTEDALDRAADLFFDAARAFWASAQGPLSALDLGPAHYRAIAAIRRAPGITPGRLIQKLSVRKQSLARVLNEAEAAGLIERRPGLDDRRERRLFLTAAGAAAEDEVSAALRERLAQAFRACGAEAVAGARLVLETLAQGAEESEA